MNDFIDHIKSANTVSCNMVSNIITLDDKSYKLYGAVLHSNWSDFKPDGIFEIKNSDYVLHGTKFVDKEKKINIEVDKYFNVLYLVDGVKKSITIEYNESEMIV